MKLKYRDLQIIKHALQQYIQRETPQVGKAIAHCFDGLVEFFKILEVTFESIEQQGTI